MDVPAHGVDAIVYAAAALSVATAAHTPAVRVKDGEVMFCPTYIHPPKWK